MSKDAKIVKALLRITKEVMCDSELTEKIEEEIRQKAIQDQKDRYNIIFTI